MNSENKKTILLVEDEALIAIMEKKLLEKKGYTVHTISTGEKAVETIVDNILPVDLILMDIDLGSGMDGTEAAAQILDHKDIPVVFLSSHTEPEVVEKTEKITSYGYVVKNSGIIVLDASIKMALKLFEAKVYHNQAEKEIQLKNEELTAANTKLLNEQVFTDSLLECLPGYLYVYDEKQNLIRWNKKHETMTGYSGEELSRMNMSDWFEGEDAVRVAAAVDEVFKKGYGEVEARLLLKGGGKLLIHSNGVLMDINGRKYFVGIGMDITGRKQAEEALKAKNEEFESTNEELTAAMEELEAANEELIATIQSLQQAEEMLKVSETLLAETESIGKVGGWSFNIDTMEQKWTDEVYHIHEVEIAPNPGVDAGINYYTKESRPVIGEAVQRAIEHGENFDLELEIITAKGNTRSVHTIGKADLKNRRVYGFFQDITERKQAEKEIQKQLNEKEILLMEVHHRVKNNIAAIEGFLTLQDEAANNPEAKSAIKSAITRVQSMRILYDKLLLSKDLHEVSMKDYIEDLIDSLHDLFDKKDNIIIEKQISDFCILSKQAVTIGIIINELLTNVYKYAFKDREGGTVSVLIKKDGNTATLIIHDNGIGIDDRIKADISTGFGLTIVKMLAEQLNGTYNIVNENGTKSVVQFEI